MVGGFIVKSHGKGCLNSSKQKFFLTDLDIICVMRLTSYLRDFHFRSLHIRNCNINNSLSFLGVVVKQYEVDALACCRYLGQS